MIQRSAIPPTQPTYASRRARNQCVDLEPRRGGLSTPMGGQRLGAGRHVDRLSDPVGTDHDRDLRMGRTDDGPRGWRR